VGENSLENIEFSITEDSWTFKQKVKGNFSNEARIHLPLVYPLSMDGVYVEFKQKSVDYSIYDF